jgi:hypothetical protein
VLIDAHTHILSLAEDAEFTTEYGRRAARRGGPALP